MTLLLSGVVAVIFGSGAFLMLKPDLFRLVVGMVLISNAAILAVMSSGLARGDAPIRPFTERVGDPLVQAMAVTALLIGLAVTALLLALVYRVYESHETVDMDELARHEASREQERVSA